MELHPTTRTCSLGLIFTVLATVAACGPPLEARAPLSAEATAPVDERLIGTWYMFEDRPSFRGHNPILLIDRGHDVDEAMKQPPTWLHVNLILMAPYKVHSYHLRAHPSDVDGVTYYNLRRTRDLPSLDYTAPGEVPGFMIMRVFVVTDDLLYVCTLGKNISDHRLQTTVEKLKSFGAEARIVGGVPRFGEQIYEEKDMYLRPVQGTGYEYVVLYATSEQLVDLIRNNPPNELFYQWAAFVRFGSDVDAKLIEKSEPDVILKIEEACGSLGLP